MNCTRNYVWNKSNVYIEHAVILRNRNLTKALGIENKENLTELPKSLWKF